VDKLLQILTLRVTHVLSLAGLTIVNLPFLVRFDAPWWVYVLALAIFIGTTTLFVFRPQTALESPELVKSINPKISQGEPSEERSSGEADGFEKLENRRTTEYEDNRGLFIGHYWEHSVKEGQKADVRVQLLAHRHPDGRKTPLEEGVVERVTYQLGENFEEETVVKRNREDNFALEFSLYSPVLCLAKVEFNDDTEPLYLSRYIDFPLVAGKSAQILYNVEEPTPGWISRLRTWM
jgi:hypothetical protein